MPPSWRTLLSPFNWRPFSTLIRRSTPKSIVRTPLTSSKQASCVPPNAQFGRSRHPQSPHAARRIWSKKEYINHLERLIAGIEEFEDIEGRRDAITARIHKYLLDTESEKVEIKAAFEERDQAVENLKSSRKTLQGVVKSVLTALDDERSSNGPASLPFYFVEQVRRYDDAKELWLRKHRASDDWERKKGIVTAKIAMAESRSGKKGWQTGITYLRQLYDLKKDFPRQEEVSEMCKNHMDNELRVLCKTSSPRCLLDLINSAAEARQKKPSETYQIDIAKTKRQFTDAQMQMIKDEWAKVQKNLKDAVDMYRGRCMSNSARIDRLNKFCSEIHKQGRTVTDTDVARFDHKWLKESRDTYDTWKAFEDRFKKNRRLAMQAGLESAEVETDIGEDWNHRDDGSVDTMGSHDIRARAHKRGKMAPLIASWVEGLDGTIKIPAEAPWSYEQLEMSSIVFAETHSVTMRASRSQKVKEWRDSCEASREQVHRDYTRLR